MTWFLITAAACAVNVYFAIAGNMPAVNGAVAVFCGLSALVQLAMLADL